ncbi:MAG: hypothetical protein E4H01_05515 [Lysobacterales bacterium]|nr:MAG: hypothetical protein E4H01_05515 [Xanthomonadales bacterium]
MDSKSAYVESVDKASRNDPDKILEAIRLEQETTIPKDIVLEDPEEARRQAWVRKNGLGIDDSESPKTTKWLEDPKNATVAKDDYDNLRSIERAVQKQKAYEGMTFGDLANTMESWAIGSAVAWKKVAWFLGKDPNSPVAMTQRKMREDAIKAGDQETIDRLDEQQAIADENLAMMKAEIDTVDKRMGELAPQNDFVAESIHAGITMAADMAPGLLVSAATRGRINPTLPWLTSKVFGDSGVEAMNAGKSYQEAMRYATVQSGLEYVWEKVPLKTMEKIVGDLGGDTFAKKIKKYAAEEILTEQGAELTQTIDAYAEGLDDEMAAAETWAERVEIQGRRQAVTLMATIIGGGGVSGTVYTADRVLGYKQRARREGMKKAFERTNSVQAQGGLDELFNLAQSSVTNQRDAASMENFLGNVALEERIYLSSEAVDLMDNVPEYIQAQLDGSGADVVIPLTTFVKDFAADADKLNEVRRYVKSAPNLQTLAELEANTDSGYIKKVMQAAEQDKELKTQADAIYDKIVTGLVKTGRQSEATARQSATLVPAVVATHYAELQKEGRKNPDGSEITMEQLFEDFGLRIVGPEADVKSEAFVSQEVPPQVQAIAEGAVTLEDGRTYHKDPAYPEYDLVLVDAAVLEEITTDHMVGPGPEFRNQISNRIEQYQQFLARTDKGTYTTPAGEEIALPETQINVGNATVLIPEGGEGYLGFGDGRHRARAMMEAGLKQIPISMSPESIINLNNILAGRRVLSQSNLSNITVEELVVDEDGNPMMVSENALRLYQAQQERMGLVEQLRGCIRG